MQRGQAELPLAQSGWRQPILVERQSCGSHVGNALVQAGDEETTDTGIDHNAEITSDNVALNVTAAILVGGAARRFGGTVKPSLRIGTERILDRQLRVLGEAGVRHVTLVGAWRDTPIVSAGIHHVADACDAAGALGGIYTALLMGTGTIVLVLAGDMPFLTAAWLRALADVGEDDAKVPCIDGRWHPLCAAYRRHTAGLLKARLDRGEFRVTDALRDLRVREVTADEMSQFDSTGMLMMNVNTPDDYREAERLARSHT